MNRGGQGWSKDLIDRREKEIREELQLMLAEQDFASACQYCLNAVLSPQIDSSCELKLICYCIRALELIPQQSQGLTETSTIAKKIEKLAKGLLAKNKVKAGKSRIAFLHGQIKQAMAKIYQCEGDSWSALWDSSMGLYLSRGSSNPLLPQQHMDFINQAIDSGIPCHIIGLIDQLEEYTADQLDRRRLITLRIRANRLSARHQSLASDLSELKHLASLDRKVAASIQWEKDFSEMILTTKHQKVHELLFSKHCADIPVESYLKYTLWLRSQEKKELCKNAPKVSGLKRFLKRNHLLKASDKRCFKVLQGIEDAYDASLPIDIRLRKAGALMSQIEQLDSEYRLLALAAMVRWLLPRQRQMASIFQAEYTSLCLKMSDGASRDVLRLLPTEPSQNEISAFFSHLPCLTRTPLRTEPSKSQENHQWSEDYPLVGNSDIAS